jgi:2-dehydropantoate 2-reductase
MAKHTLLLAVGARYRRLRSSMLAAIERGRPPAVEFLNGEVISRAEQHGLAAPINRAARDLVWSIARGEAEASHSTLRALYERTR